jgi:hypothetical protein
MATQKGKMKCKQDIYEDGLSIMYDFVQIKLTEGKWYDVSISKFSIHIIDNSKISFMISSSDLEKYFYSLTELRKLKIEKMLKQFNF